MEQSLKQIDQIELKVKKLIVENGKLNRDLEVKRNKITALESKLKETLSKVKEGEDEIKVLKTANAMLGSDEYKTKTKLKINALVREIDQCIAQLT